MYCALGSERWSNLRFLFVLSISERGLAERHSLVGGKESHELRSLGNLNGATLVDIEVAPGLSEVSFEIGLECITSETLVGSKDFLGGALSTSLIEEEVASRLAFVGLLAIFVFLAGFLLNSVGFDHGSHENVIITGGEVSREDSGVFGIIIILGLPSVVETIAGDLDLSIIVKGNLGVHGNELANWDSSLKLDVGSVRVLLSSSISLRGSVGAETVLGSLLSSVVENGFELPNLSGGVKDDTGSSANIVSGETVRIVGADKAQEGSDDNGLHNF